MAVALQTAPDRLTLISPGDVPGRGLAAPRPGRPGGGAGLSGACPGPGLRDTDNLQEQFAAR